MPVSCSTAVEYVDFTVPIIKKIIEIIKTILILSFFERPYVNNNPTIDANKNHSPWIRLPSHNSPRSIESIDIFFIEFQYSGR